MYMMVPLSMLPIYASVLTKTSTLSHASLLGFDLIWFVVYTTVVFVAVNMLRLWS